MYTKIFVLFLLFAVMFPFMGGCSAFKSNPPNIRTDPVTGEQYNINDTPMSLLTIHPVVEYSRCEDDEISLKTGNAKDASSIWVKAKPAFHSSVVIEITPLPTDKPDYYALRLKLSPRGEKWWNKMVDDNYQKKMAIALDGNYLGSFIAQDPSSDEKTVVEKKGNSIILQKVQEETATPEPDVKEKTRPSEAMMDKPGWVIIPGPFHETLVKSICKNSKRNYIFYIEQAKREASDAKKEADEKAKTDPEAKFKKEMESKGSIFTDISGFFSPGSGD